MDKDDLAALLVDATAEEVDQIHRLLHEWSVGPDTNFPVQLTLLTKAQWRIAASLPRVMNDSRKLIELHLNEYRQHSKTMADNFASNFKQQAAGIKTVVETHAKTIEQSAKQIRARLNEAEAVAQNVKVLMDDAAWEWKTLKTSTKLQCDQLQQVCNDLDNRFVWQGMLRSGVVLLLAVGGGILIGHYWIR